MLRLISLVPLLPLAGFVGLGLFGRRLRHYERVVGLIACGTIAAAFAISVGAVSEYATTRWSPEANRVYRSSEAGDGFPHTFMWIPGGGAVRSLGEDALEPVVGGFSVRWDYQLDALS